MQKNVLEYLDKTVKKFPKKIAIVDEKDSINFLDLKESSQSIAIYLQTEQIQSKLPIGVFLPKSIDAIKSFLAIIYNGCFYVPLDVKNPFSRLESIINNIDIKIIITNKEYAKFLEKLPNMKIILLDNIDFNSNTLLNLDNYKLSIDIDPVYLINTSGSTGIPKGVVINHRSIIEYIDWAKSLFSINETINIGNQAPFVFDNSVLDIYLMFACGSTLYLIPENLFMFPPKLIDYLENKKINFIFWVPSIMSNISKLNLLNKKELYLKYILFAGEIMPTKVLNQWKKYFINALFANLYGPTEITVDCTYYIVDRNFKDNEPLPIGYPCNNTDILVLDDKNKLITKDMINTIGELCVRGSSLALGYYNNQAKTDEVFVQNPLNSHYPEKIYKTGDIVFYNKRGELIYKGRKDFQIKHMGYRIELGEIETAILATKSIDNACVLYDQNNKNIVLIYESQDKISKRDIILNLHKNLPKYMLPNRFIYLENMPLNANGKIDRNKLKDLF